MKKGTARDIAQALVGRMGEGIDSFAFEQTELSEGDQIKVLKEIKLLCGKMIDKVELKYSTYLGVSTAEIIRSILD